MSKALILAEVINRRCPSNRSRRCVDFQRGELEWGTNNIYFDHYSYALDVKELRSK